MLATALGCAAGVLRGAGGADEAAALIRGEFFAETVPGMPSLAADRIDEAFVKRLYGAHPDAVKALGRILATSEYWDLNMRIGAVRNRVNLEVWASIVADFDIRIELNNAGKMNGAISDLDQTLFCDAEEIVTKDGRVIPRDQVHPFLIEEFERRFRQRMDIPAGRSVGDAYDMMHFRGDGMMKDWRMSKSRWTTFLVELDASIEALSKTEGAYFKPGAYKTQVYSRYQNEGTTIVLQKEAGEGSGKTTLAGYGEIEAPPGVAIRGGNTRELSLLYRDVPFGVDRTGALGSVMENIYHGAHIANLIKQAKYGNRWVDNALVHLTNLEVDFRLLLLQGRDGARRHFVRKIFKPFEGKLPPGIDNLDEIQRIIEVQQRIELDKVVRGAPPAGQRPKHWSGEWQQYEPRDIGQTQVKLAYYAQEAAEVRQALAAGAALFEAAPSPGSAEFEAEVARLAEARFADKLRQVGQMAAARAAAKVFGDVFTRQGFARQRQLYGPEAARRLLVERVRELHVALVFADEPELIRSVVDSAPAEARGAVMALHDIARAQRRAIVERAGTVESITAGELKASNRVLFDLMRRLDVPESEGRALLGADDAPRAPAGPRSIRSFADTHWTDRHVALVLGRGIFDAHRDGEQIRSRTVADVIRDPGGVARDVAYKTYAYNAGRMQDFFNTTLPSLFEVRSGWKMSPFGREFVEGFADLGTLDSAAKVGLAVVQGDRAAAEQEIRDLILGNVPVGNELYGLAKSLKAYQGGESFPLMMYLTKHGLKLHPEGGPYAAMMGFLVTLYGIEKTIYEFGWWAYGQPTQNEVVSLVLTGERGAVPMQGWESRLPAFRQPETTDLLKKFALLDKHVPVPDLPRAYRERMLRGMFLASANRKAWSKVDHNAGRHSDWHVAREQALAENYFQNWRYWFQRMWFYHRIHPLVFAAMGRRAEQPGQHWQGIYDTPPSFLQDVPHAQQIAQYGDAYRPSADGRGSWDHERIHLRRFFERWLVDWEKAWSEARQEHGEFFSLLDNARIAGDWRKATVDELIKYYIEGEAFYLENPEAPSPPGLDEARRSARDANARGIRGMPDRAVAAILNDTRGQGRREIEAIESLFWHPKVEAALLDGIRNAAEKTDRAPVEPRLSVRVPRPAVRAGRPVPMDVTVLGDRATMPEDIEISVDYRKTGDHEGRRPEGVLKDDVLIAFGRQVPDEQLRVVEHAATVTAASPDGKFRLSETVPVFWLAHKAEEAVEPTESEAQEPGAGGPGGGAAEDAGVAAERADAVGAEARDLCGEARSRARATMDRARAAAGDLDALLEHLRGIENQMGQFELGRLGWEALRDRIETAGFEVAMLRDQIGQDALKLCEATERLLRAATVQEREALQAELRGAHERVGKGVAEARETVRAIEADVAKAREIVAAGERLGPALAEAEKRLTDIGDVLAALGDVAEPVRALLRGVGERMALLDALRGQVAALAPAGMSAGGEGRGPAAVAEAIGRIEAAKNLLRDCPGEVEELLANLERVRAEAEARDATAREQLGGLKERFAKGGSAASPEALKNLEASLEAARIFMESITHYGEQADQCMAAAARIAARPLLVHVPDLLRLAADAAKAKIEALGLVAGIVGGDPAPEPELAFRVQAQDPPPGTAVRPGSRVAVRLFGQAVPKMVRVPNVLSGTAERARQVLVGAGLTAAITAGGPAPPAFAAGMVAEQEPREGSMVPAGSAVRVTIFGEPMRPKVRVPPVVGLGAREAQASLAGSGLAPKLAEGVRAATGADSGKVYAQDPPAGAEVEAGSAVSVQYHAAAPPMEPQVPVPATEAREFFVVFANCAAKGLFEMLRDPEAPPRPAPQAPPSAAGGLFGGINALMGELTSVPKGQREAEVARMKQRLRNLDMSRLEFVPDPKSLTLLHVSGEGAQAYKADMFQPSAKFASPISFSISGTRSAVIHGALLFHVAGCFPDLGSVQAVYPKARMQFDAASENTGAPLPLSAGTPDGRFSVRLQDARGGCDIAGGPLVAGWPDELKRAHAAMLLDLGFSCAAESAYLGRPGGGARQLAALRCLRDEVLVRTAPGRAVVDFYYGRFTPVACGIMRSHPWTRAAFGAGFDVIAAAIGHVRGGDAREMPSTVAATHAGRVSAEPGGNGG